MNMKDSKICLGEMGFDMHMLNEIANTFKLIW